MAKFALVTHDLNLFQNLAGYSVDVNPESFRNDYRLIFVYLDVESNLNKLLNKQPKLKELQDQLVGVYMAENQVQKWLAKSALIKGSITIDQFKFLMENNSLASNHTGIFLKVKNRLEKIHFKEIRWIMAKDVYSIIRTSDARYLVSHSLKEMEEKLAPFSNFKRIHRSYLVNLDFIEAIEEGEVIIESESIPIGPAYKEDLLSGLLFM